MTARAVTDDPIVGAIREAALRHAEQPAVADEYGVVTYGEAWARATVIASALRLRVASERPVGVLLERTRLLPVALLGVLRAGCAYVPLEARLPDGRITQMLRIADVGVLVSERSLAWRCDRLAPTVVWADATAGASVAADRDRPGRLAYVIFTSGSTGEPKGVAMPRHALANLLRWQVDRSGAASRRTLGFAPIGFDVSFQEIFSTWSAGGCVYVLSEERRRELGTLAQVAQEIGATRLFVPPVVLQRLCEGAAAAGCYPPELEEVIVAGEQLHITPQVRAFFRHCPKRPRLDNQYGPAETHVVSAYTLTGDPTQWPDFPPIGQPLPNVAIELRDSDGRVAQTARGEIFISGVCLADGYVGREDLTIARFGSVRPSPRRFYRTGDLATFGANGDITFVGRSDDQIKIRGYRVEPREVQTVIERAPGVARAAVLVRDHDGRRALIAFYVPRQRACTSAGIHRFLAARLPEYMIPSRILPIQSMPLSKNGKVDRTTLMRAADRRERGVREDVASVEAEVRRVLGGARLSATTDFFRAGGDSLSAAELAARLARTYGRSVLVADIFRLRTPRRISQYLTTAKALRHTETASFFRPTQLTPEVQRVLFLEQLHPGTGAFNVAVRIKLRGRIEPDALNAAFEYLIARHEALRAHYMRGGRVVAAASDTLQFEVARLTLRPHAQPRDRAARWATEAGRPFDLTRAPLIRACLLSTTAFSHDLVIVAHHTVADGWSLERIVDEVLELYTARLTRASAQLPPARPLEPRPTTSIQRQTAARYWANYLAHAPTQLDLATDHPRPSRSSLRGSSVPVRISPEITAAVVRRSERLGVSPFCVLLAAWGLSVAAFASQETVCVGVPVSTREASLESAQIGTAVAVFPAVVSLKGNEDIQSLLRRTRTDVADITENWSTSFQEIVQQQHLSREVNRHPIFQTALAYQHRVRRSRSVRGLRCTIEMLPTGWVQLDTLLTIELRGRHFAGALEFATDLFEPSTARRLRELFVLMLGALASRPLTARVAELVVAMSAAHARRGTRDFSRPHLRPFAHVAVGRWARERPEAVAVHCGAEVWTYRELDLQAEHIATALRARRLGRDAVVGVLLGRSPMLYAALLGTWKAGAAFLPIAAETPRDRVEYMLGNAGVQLLLADAGSDADGFGIPQLLIERTAEPAVPFGLGAARPVQPDDLAYVLYTSGSTGRPKGVRVTHGGLANLLHAQATVLRPAKSDRVVQFFSFAFDGAIFEMLLALGHGATCYMLTDAQRRLGEVGDVLEHDRITIATLTPTVLQFMKPHKLRALRLLIAAGEPCPASVVARWAPGRRFVNAYGPTEATIWSSSADCRPGRPVTIGRPIPGIRFDLLSASKHPVPYGAVGEIHIVGVAVARGYVSAAGLSQDAFDLSLDGHQRRYRSGDLARYVGNGELEYRGRRDRQLKLRGYRIEPGEIERMLVQHPFVRAAAVVLRGAGSLTAHLTAYLVPPGPTTSHDLVDVRAFVERQLPLYMVPSAWRWTDSLPLTTSGKLDEAALPDARPLGGAAETPVSPIEARVAAIWTELLGQPVCRTDDFFALGGHSLLALEVIARLRDSCGVEVGVDELLATPRLAEFSARIERVATASSLK